MIQPFVIALHSPVLGRSYQEVGVVLQTGLHELEYVTVSISYMDPHHTIRRLANCFS
jgi:hypothetical protein